MVRHARPKDAEAIARVHVRTWQAAYAHVFPPERLAELSVADRAEGWRAHLKAREMAVFVAEREPDGVVGFGNGGASRDVDGEGELYGLYVLPEAWDTGAGRALLEAVEDALRAQSYEEATLWVLEDNPRARRFYERQGWTLDGARELFELWDVSPPELRYRKRL
jgi:ribosomal protein S18 acetylase RimI-like enzyme